MEVSSQPQRERCLIMWNLDQPAQSSRLLSPVSPGDLLRIYLQEPDF